MRENLGHSLAIVLFTNAIHIGLLFWYFLPLFLKLWRGARMFQKHPSWLKKKKPNSMFLHSLSLRLEASVCQNGAAYLFRKAPPPRLFFRRPLARLSPSFCSQSYVVLEGKTGAEERVSVVFTPDAKCLLVACLNGFTSMSKASFPNSPPLCQ